MQFKLFGVAATGDSEAEEELNRFSKGETQPMTHRIGSIVLVLAALPVALAGAQVVADPADGSGTRYALLIGADAYWRAEKLHYCSADVQALADRLAASGFAREHIYLLHDKMPQTKDRPVKDNIEDRLKLVLGLVEKDDLVLVAFSGHGIHRGAKSYLCPTNVDLDNTDTMISLDAVYRRLQQSAASLKILLVDACRNDPRLGGKSLESAKEVERFAAEKPPQGILQLTSCGPGEKSYEDVDFQHSVFMNYVLEGLEGRADANRNGWVSLFELASYTNDKTKNFVADKYSAFQRPRLQGDTPDFDFSPVVHPVITNSIGMKLAFIPAGEFMMGSPESEADRGDNEKQHRVRITRPFYMGVYEVTQEQYERVMGENPSYFSSTGRGKDEVAGRDTRNHPVETVSWDDAVEFCRKLSAQEGRTYRLPTDAEWEYACRAGTQTPFHFGSQLNGREANCDGNYPYGTQTKGPYLERTTEVGSYRPSAWGLYDMHGNVWEWCQDWYDSDYYANSPTDDPQGPSSGSNRVFRGGSWSYLARNCRSAIRYYLSPGLESTFLGFRLALVPAD